MPWKQGTQESDEKSLYFSTTAHALSCAGLRTLGFR